MGTEIETAAAIEYARAHDLRAILIACGGEIVAQAFGEGVTADTPSALYSGTKSFWGPVALCAQDDGVLDLDEPVFETLGEWRDDPWKRRVTARMLLSLTAGFGFGGLGAAVPIYERALAIPLKNEPGSRFTYGGISLQVFGAVLARKLAPRTPHDYLHERVLLPAGVRVASWRRLTDGTQPLPTGASLSAHDWLAYGHYVLREHSRLAQCFTGSPSQRALRPRLVARREPCARRSHLRKRLRRTSALHRAVARTRNRPLRAPLLIPPRDLPQTPLSLAF